MRVCIVGTSRCGTSILRQLLHLHPRLRLFGETHWLPRMFEFAGHQRIGWRALYDIAAKTTWDNGRDLLTANRVHSGFAEDEALLGAFRAALTARGAVTIQEFNALFAETCFGTDVSWGDKTPDYGFYMRLIQQLWPGCRFIHIVRDGLDTARSMSLHSGCQLMVSNGYDNWCSLSYDRLYEKYQRRELPLEAYVASWRRRMERIRDEATRLRPGSYLELRYDALQDAPAAVLKQAADWLELEADAAWLDRAAALVRPREAGATHAQSVLDKLPPEDLHYVNREWRQPGGSAGTTGI